MQMFLEFWGILEERVPSWIGLDYHSISNDIFLPTFKPRLRKDSFIFPNIASSPHHCETMAAFKSIHYDSSVNDASMPAPNLVWRLKNSVAVGCHLPLGLDSAMKTIGKADFGLQICAVSLFAYFHVFVYFCLFCLFLSICRSLPICLFSLLKFSSAISQECPTGFHLGLELAPPATSAPSSPIAMAYEREVTEVRQERGTIR